MTIVPSHHTAIRANSLEHKERYDIITDEEWYTGIHLKVDDTGSLAHYLSWLRHTDAPHT